MHKQRSKVEEVEVGQQVGYPCREGATRSDPAPRLYKPSHLMAHRVAEFISVPSEALGTSPVHTRQRASVTTPDPVSNLLTTGQGPGESHDEVSQVVGVTNHTPPSRHEQLPPCGSRNGFQTWRKTANKAGSHRALPLHLTHSPQETQLTSHTGVRRILSECVLLGVSPTEDVVANS